MAGILDRIDKEISEGKKQSLFIAGVERDASGQSLGVILPVMEWRWERSFTKNHRIEKE